MKTNVRRFGFTLIELLVVIAIIVILASLVGSFAGCNRSSGTGEKIGQVVKLSKEGFIRKTWEGQLIRGGMNGGSGAFGTVPFNFTVGSEELAKTVQKFMREQTEVIITYRIGGLYSPLSSGSDGHFLISIEPANK